MLIMPGLQHQKIQAGEQADHMSQPDESSRGLTTIDTSTKKVPGKGIADDANNQWKCEFSSSSDDESDDGSPMNEEHAVKSKNVEKSVNLKKQQEHDTVRPELSSDTRPLKRDGAMSEVV